MASKKVKVDFTGVESFNRASEGQHVVKIATAEMRESQGGNDMISVAFEVTKGQDKGARVFENYPLAENALWKLKGMLQAIGMKCEGKVQLDLDKLVGKMCIIEVAHEEYEGKLRARVQECRKLAAAAEDDEDEVDEDEFDDDEEEEEETTKKKTPEKKEKSKPASKKKAPMNPPEDEDEDDEDEDEDDEDWDEGDDEEEEEPAPKKKDAKKSAPAKKTPAKKAPAKKKPEPEDDDDEDEDDDDDWDEE